MIKRSQYTFDQNVYSEVSVGWPFWVFLCSKYSLENSTWILYTDTTTGRWEAWQTLGCPPMPPHSLKSPHSPPPPLKSPRGPPRPLTAGPNLPASLRCVLFRPTATRAQQFPSPPLSHWTLTLFRVGGGPNQPPLSRICVYACEYAYMGANFLWLFLIFSMEEVTRLSTQ